MATFDVSVAGRVYIDHVFAGFDAQPKLGTELYCRSYNRSIGGGAAITSFWLGSLQRSVQLACITGRDDTAWFQNEMARAGVDTGMVRSSELNTGVTAAISFGGDREYFTHLGANIALDEYLAEPDTVARLCRGRHLHVTVPLCRTVAARVIGGAHEAGMTVSLDVGYQPAWYANPENLATLREVDFFFPNETEAGLLGIAHDQPLSGWFADSRREGSPSARWVVVKLGAGGAVAVNRVTRVAVKAPVVECIDTTGAGEAFNAGFIDAYLHGGAIGAWLQEGCACGALCVGGLGGVATVNGRHAVDEIMRRTYGI